MKKIKHTEAPGDIDRASEQSEIVEDFLPKPSELIMKEDNIKVTLELKQAKRQSV